MLLALPVTQKPGLGNACSRAQTRRQLWAYALDMLSGDPASMSLAKPLLFMGLPSPVAALVATMFFLLQAIVPLSSTLA
jgi:hypothetical protein